MFQCSQAAGCSRASSFGGILGGLRSAASCYLFKGAMHRRLGEALAALSLGRLPAAFVAAERHVFLAPVGVVPSELITSLACMTVTF